MYDPDDTTTVWRFIPETGNNGAAGGSYLLLDECPGCARGTGQGAGGSDGSKVPMASIANLADLGLYLEYIRPTDERARPRRQRRRPEVPIEFFNDPGHARGCPLR